MNKIQYLGFSHPKKGRIVESGAFLEWPIQRHVISVTNNILVFQKILDSIFGFPKHQAKYVGVSEEMVAWTPVLKYMGFPLGSDVMGCGVESSWDHVYSHKLYWLRKVSIQRS